VSPGAGSVVALVGQCQPADALAVASRWIPRGWSIAASKTEWGAALIAGPDVFREDHRVFIGTAVADPWGLPGAPLDRRILLDRFARYGDQTSQLAAGPFAFVDLARANVTAALNGIVPVFLSRGARIVVGSHSEMVAALAGGAPPVPVPAGSSASVDGTIANVARFGVWESLPLMSLPALAAEIEHHISAAGPSRQVHRGVFVALGLHVRWIGKALVASPPFRPLDAALDVVVEFQAIRRQVSNLWWQAGLRNAHLFVPAFERPALDSLTLTMHAK
jgi:hypothetical protein